MKVSKCLFQYLVKHSDDWHEGAIADITIRRMKDDIVYILAIQSKYRPIKFYRYPLSCGGALMEYLRITNLRDARGIKVEFTYSQHLRRLGYGNVLTMQGEYSAASYYEVVKEMDECEDDYYDCD